ncbi:MAG: CAP domain-containing protein [Acidimicrobiales bacterium]
MRHGIVAASALLLVLTLGSWILVDPATTGASVDAVTATATVLPSTTPVPSTTVPSTTLPSTSLPSTSLPSTSLPTASPVTPPVELAFLDALNAVRGNEDLVDFTRETALDGLAQSWVENMVQEGELRHSTLIYDVIAGSWTTAGENVGFGPTTGVIVDAFMDSPGHRANIVNPSFTEVGIGVAIVDGVVWTAHLFAG